MTGLLRVRKGLEADTGKRRFGPTVHRLDRGHGQARRVDAIQTRGLEHIAHLHIGITSREAQLHAPGLGLPEGHPPLLGAQVEHGHSGILIRDQGDLGRQGVHPRDLTQHTVLVDDRHPWPHALHRSTVDHHLA